MSLVEEANHLLQFGVLEFRSGEYTKAREHFHQYLTITQTIIKDHNKAVVYQHIGLTFKRQGNFDDAIKYYKLALETAEKNNQIAEKANAISNLGVIYKNKGIELVEQDKQSEAMELFLSSIKYYQQVRQLDYETNNMSGVASDLLNMGIVYYRMNERTKAIGAFNECISIVEKYKNDSILGKAYHGIGMVHLNIQDYDNALSYFLKAKNIFLSYACEKQDILLCLLNIGNCLFYKGELKSAKPYFIEALEICHYMENPLLIKRLKIFIEKCK